MDGCVLALITALFLVAGAFLIPAAPGVYSCVSSEDSSQPVLLSISAPTGLIKVSTDNNPLPAFKWSASANATSDELIDSRDITRTERIIAGLNTAIPSADANLDGSINAVDITMIERIIVGLE